MLRSFLCDFSDVTDGVYQLIRYPDDVNLKYVYLEMDHLDDRYKVTRLHPIREPDELWLGLPRVVAGITTTLAGVAVAGPDIRPDPERSTDLVDSRGPMVAPPAPPPPPPPGGPPPAVGPSVQFLCFDYRYVPTMQTGVRGIEVYDIGSIFNSHAYLDREYAEYCNRNCEAPLSDDTLLMRDMQIQERVGALAGTMARRYSPVMSISKFVDNMQHTSRQNDNPMDMAHTIETLSLLDIRRGPGTYSDYIRVPAPSPAVRLPMGRYMPLYDGTWSDFLLGYNRLVGTLVPHGH